MRLIALVTAGAVLIALTACASETGFEFSQNESTPAETQTAAPAAIEGDTNLDGKLSEWEKSMIIKHAAHDYTLPDGSVVTVDPAQPLPAAVVAAITEKAAANAGAANTTDSDARLANYSALISVLEGEAAATGRGVAAVISSHSDGVGTFYVIAASGTKQAPLMGSTDKATAVADATAWATNRGYELIVY